MTQKIFLTQNQEALVDDEDYERVSQHKWYAGKIRNTYYAMHGIQKPDGHWTTEYMHNLITGYPQTDHKNGNGLDNQKKNLRLASDADNQHNYRLPRNNTSGYKGVNWDKRDNKWRARITVNGKQRTIGRYDDIIEAARAYDEAARNHFGEFARTNL